MYTALAEAHYDITAAETALVPYGHIMKSSSRTDSHHELPTIDTAVTVTVSNNDSKSAAASETPGGTAAINILTETAATDAVSVSESAHQSREQISVTDTTATSTTASTAVNGNTAAGSSQLAFDRTDVTTDDVNVATQIEQQQSSTEQLCTNYTAADSTGATAATSKDSIASANTDDAVVATAMDVDSEITPVVAAVASTTAVVPLAAAVPLHVKAVQQQSPVIDTIAATVTDSEDTTSAAPTAMDVDTTIDKLNDDVKAKPVNTVAAAVAVTAATTDTTDNSGGSSSSSVTAMILRKSSKGKNKARLTAAANTSQTTTDDSAHDSGSSSSSSTIDSSSASNSSDSSLSITVTGTVGHKLGIEYTNTANTMTSWTADERNRYVKNATT
jgi:hypothetical protein